MVSTRFKHWKKPNPKHNKLTEWNWMVAYPQYLHIGESVDIGAFSYLNARFGIWLGDYVQIGSHCSLYTIDSERDITGPIKIGKNTRIGTHSTIFPDVTIGSDCFIYAYSIITRDVKDNMIVKPYRAQEVFPCVGDA